MITTNGLTKVYDGKVAVEALTMEIRPGEIFGLLGPNGAGKTTTVRMLAALIAPTAGEAIIGGYRLGEQDAAIRRLVGIVTEAPGLYERLSARENLEVYARLYGVANVARQVEKYLRLLDLWDRRDEPVGTFSKGMKQKLALARALVHEPKILLLDEPTSGLDPQMTRVVREFIADLRSQGRTILLCTHNLDEAERLCDRILVLKTRPIALDTPEALHRRLFGRRIVVTLAEVTAGILERVRTLPFVRDLQCNGRQLYIALADPEHENPYLVRALVEAGAAIQFLTEEEHSLEEIYLRLLEEEAAAQQAEAASAR
ncbi:MAG: ABC transporter ATP-binding protein [Blastocatellia bacterium]|nr:ABC transporter ATP-binding protein [Blastocatellia bacterium]